MNLKHYIIILLIFCQKWANGQQMTREQYVSKYYSLAVREMNLYKIPASITLAQGILETNSGNSDLAVKAKNHFGIKCQNSWTGMKYIKDDDKKDECFRVYANPDESFRDHSIFLHRPRYEKLFTYDISDYKSWAYGLKEAGYATNPNYPQILIKHIEELKLYNFDHYGENTISSPIISKDTIKVLKIQKDTSSTDTAIKPFKLTRKIKANNLNYIIIDSSFNIDKLAMTYKIAKNDLLNYNDLKEEQNVEMGQNFFLEKKLKENFIGLHEVNFGESLFDISQLYGIQLEQLKMYNKVERWDQPIVGEIVCLNKMRTNYFKSRPYFELQQEKLNIKMKNEKEAKKIEEQLKRQNMKTSDITNNIKSLDSKAVLHVVSQKETIFKICKLYGCTPSDIYKWNNLPVDEVLKTGQQLKIFINPNPVNE